MTAALIMTPAIVLLLAGVSHLTKFSATANSVARHRLIQPRFTIIAVAGLALVESAVGGGTVAAVLMQSSTQRRWAFACVVVLVSLSAYAHLAAVRQADPDLPCACGMGEAPLGMWATLRPAMLAVLAALGGLLVPATDGWLQRPLHEQAIVICAGLSLSITMTLLPATRAPLPTGRALEYVR